MMQVLILLLVIVWAAVLVPPWLRSRAGHSPQSSIAGFNRRLSVLATRSGTPRPLPGFSRPLPAIPPHARASKAPAWAIRQSEAQRRRTLILYGLTIVAASCFVLGLLPALRFFWALMVLDLVALAGYVVLLLQWKHNRRERSEKVRALPNRPPVSSSLGAAEPQAR